MISPNSPRSHTALTLIELIVIIFVVFVFCALSIPNINGPAPGRAKLTNSIYNAKQIHLAVSAAAVDGEAGVNNELVTANWPAEVSPRPNNASDFIRVLATGSYLTSRDLRVFGLKKKFYPGEGAFDAENHCAFTIFNVSEADSEKTIFLTTRNVQLNETQEAFVHDPTDQWKLGTKGFVVFRKGGDGAVYGTKPEAMSRIGELPNSTPTTLKPGGPKFIPPKSN